MEKNSKLRILLRMLKLVKPLSGHMLLAVIFGTLGFLTAQFIPVLGGYAVLSGLGMYGEFSWKVLLIMLIVFALLRAVFRFSEQRMNHYIAFTLLAIVRDKVFKALRRLCPAKLEGRDKGDLISLITADVELMEVFYAHTVSPVCIAVITEIIMSIFISSFHPLLGVMAMAAYVTVGLVLPLIISARSGNLGDELRAMSGELSSHMLESIRGIDETQQYNGGRKRLKEITEKTNGLSAKQGVLSNLAGTNSAIGNTLILVFDITMFLLSYYLYLNGNVDFAGFLIPVIALMSSFGPVIALSALGTTLQSTVASGARVLSIVDEEPETHDIEGKEKTCFDGASVRDVSFTYGSGPILEDISLEVPQRKILGIVGKSGCGKSTLLKLLMRFWKVEEGAMEISDTNVEKINTDNLRDMESYMTQETRLFKDTIANNIRIAKLDASDEEVGDRRQCAYDRAYSALLCEYTRMHFCGKGTHKASF